MTDLDTSATGRDDIDDAIGDILTSLVDGLRADTQANPGYAAMIMGTPAQALQLVWDDASVQTIAAALHLQRHFGLQLRQRVLDELFNIETTMSDYRALYERDGLGGSTDRAFADYRRRIQMAFIDTESPYAQIPGHVLAQAMNVDIYDHVVASPMRLLRWLEYSSPMLMVLHQVSTDAWGVDKADHDAYRRHQSILGDIYTGAATYLLPTDAELTELAGRLYGNV